MKLGLRNGQQFKAKIRNLAKQKQVSPQVLMQEVALDEIVDRISRSPYREQLILKGGFLIASMIGIDTRSTRDLDTSVRGLPVTKDEMLKVFNTIVKMNETDGDVTLRITKIDEIRSGDNYEGFRIHLEAKIFASVIDTKIDISTGDVITPHEVSWYHHTIFNDQKVMVMAYNMETILAEKIEGIVARQEQTTRMKDYYDLYLFDKVRREQINFTMLETAINATAKLRGTDYLLPKYHEIIREVSNSKVLAERWKKYSLANAYSQEISYQETCDAALDLIQQANL